MRKGQRLDAVSAAMQEEVEMLARLDAQDRMSSLCVGGCGRQVARRGARCIICANQHPSKAGRS